MYSCGLNDPPEYYSNPSTLQFTPKYCRRNPKLRLTVIGVEEVGGITSKFEKDFDFGPSLRTTYNARLGRNVEQFSHQLQVRFGDKGANLQFRNLLNGKVVDEAVIEFGRR
jgi:hypothetical protein